MSSFNGFIIHLLRSEYGVFQLGPSITEGIFFDSLIYFSEQMLNEILWIGIPLSLVGIAIGIRRKIVLLVLLFSGFLSYIFLFHLLARFPVQDEVYREVLSRFWQQPILLLSIFAGFGALYLSEAITASKRNLIVALSLIISFMQIGLNFKNSDQSKDTLFYEFGKNLLEHMPTGSVYLPFGDLDFFITLYLQKCEGLRPDITILSQSRMTRSWYINRVKKEFPHLNFGDGNFSLLNFFNQNINSMPIFISSRYPGIQNWESDYEAWPFGFNDQVIRKNQIPSSELLIKDTWGPFPNILSKPTNFHPWQAHISDRYWWSKSRRTYLLGTAILSRRHEDLRSIVLKIEPEIIEKINALSNSNDQRHLNTPLQVKEDNR